MALLFSNVRVSSPDGNEAEFLVSGIPREFDDFEHYTTFEDFLDGIEEDTEISVHADAYDEFDSKEIYDQATAETAELFNDLRKALHQAISKCVVKNVDEFIGYVELTKAHHKNSPFVLAFGNKALQIPYSDDICEEIFDFLDMLDTEYLRPELFTDVESDDDGDDEDEAPPMCMAYGEPLVERDFEG